MDERRDEGWPPADGGDPGLEQDLRALFEGAAPPDEVRRRLAAEAERRFGKARRWRVLPRVALPIAAAAAALLVSVLALRTRGDAGPEATEPREQRVLASADAPAVDRRDLDGDGAVDVFDGYLLARAVRAGETAGLPDVDGDGRVTRADAEALVARVVEVAR